MVNECTYKTYGHSHTYLQWKDWNMYTTFSHVSATRPYHTLLSFSWTGRDGEYLYRLVFTSAGSRPFLLCCRRREMRTRTGTGSRRVAFGAAAHLDFLTFDLFTFTTFTSLQSPSNTSYPTYLTYLTNQLFHTRPQWRPRAPTATTTTDTPSHP